MSAQHTPAPWSFRHEMDEGHYEISASSGHEVIGQVFYVDNVPCARGEADARLIAASPELLNIAVQLEESLTADGYDSVLVRDLRAAIAKATGAA